MMVVTYLSELRILQPFTSDPSEIMDALREVRTFSGGRPQRDSARQDVLDRMWEEADRSSGFPTGYNMQRTRSYNDMLNFADQEAFDLIGSLDALREVVSFLVGLPGRKAVVYISNGIPMVPGMDLFNAYASAIHDLTVLSEIQRYDRSASFQSLVDWANTQDVSLYTVGAGGLEVPGMSTTGQRSNRAPVAPAPAMDGNLEALRYMAKGTGGLAIVKTNDFTEGFERIEQDLHSYYSIGYRLTPTGTDKVHRIEVTLPDHPELELRFRSRFVEKSLETQVQERVLASLVHDIADNPMELEVQMGSPSLSTGERFSVPVHVSFPIGRVALLPEGEEMVGRVVLFVAARDAGGKSSEAVREEYEIRLPADSAESLLTSPFSLSTSLLMEAGAYRIALGLMDEVTRQASYSTVVITLSPR
jgi:VWFA-related protein